MMETVGTRIKAFRESRNLTQKDVFQDTQGEIKQTTLSAVENNQAKPGFDTLNALLAAYPALSSDWLLLGTGPMLRDGRALTPAPRAAEPAADYTSGGSTEQTLYISVLKEQVADLKADKTRLLGENDKLSSQVSELLGKSSDSSDAAGLSDEAPTDPYAPTFAGGAAPLPRLRVQGLVRYAEEAAELS